eukprot:1037117_1
MTQPKQHQTKRNTNWRHQSVDSVHDDDAKHYGEKDDDLESCCSIQTQAFIPPARTRHRYNRGNRVRDDNSHRRHMRDRDSSNPDRPGSLNITIKPDWKRMPYDKTHKQSQHKVAQIIKYGQYCKMTATLTEYLIFYGTRTLHINIYGEVVGLYDGGFWSWATWFWYFLGGNTVYDLNVFKRIDLFGTSTVCGLDLIQSHETALKYITAICKRGYLDGLKHLIETLHINPFANQLVESKKEFTLLVETVYRFNAAILKYLLLDNDFYPYFDVDHEKNSYGETLWNCCTKQLKNIITPGSGWLHCLECLHYAPYLIYEIHGPRAPSNLVNDGQNEFEGDGIDNWMVHESNAIHLNIETVEIPQQFVKERLKIIHTLADNKPVTFKLESCYYGLCVDAAGSKPHCIHFWKPHITKAHSVHFFEYVPCHVEDNNNNVRWGRLRMTLADKFKKINVPHGCWLTVIAHRNMVRLSPITTDDAQFWRIKQIALQNGDNIWIQVINKLGYKLIFNSKPSSYALNSSMPTLSVSNKVNEIHPLCVDLFSVAANNQSTRYAFYAERYDQKQGILKQLGSKLCVNSFWRLPTDGAQFHATKYQCYKKRVKDIAQILWCFKQRHLVIKARAEPKYTTEDISCPGCKLHVIVCKEYWHKTCVYGHAKKSDHVNGGKLFCEFGRGCPSSRCNRRHDFDGNVSQLKCPWECGSSKCKNIDVCPYFHDGQIGVNGQRKWDEGSDAYGVGAPSPYI